MSDCSITQDPETHRITDLFCFYSLPSTALKATPHTNVNAAYLFYYATTAAPSCADLGDGSVAVPVKNWKDETPEERKVLGDRLKALMSDALVVISKVRSQRLVHRLVADSSTPVQNGFDVMNALTLQDNSLFLEDLKVRYILRPLGVSELLTIRLRLGVWQGRVSRPPS